MIKVCISCGKEYSTYHKEQEYCSKSCAKKGNGKPLKEHNCIICGSPCKGHRAPCGKMRYPKTCSDECASMLLVEIANRQREQTLFTREKAFAEKFNTKYAGRFVYIGGYKNCESIITCKCLKCGTERTISAQRIRRPHIRSMIPCECCIEIEKAQATKQQKYCAICGVEIDNSRIVCSTECEAERAVRMREQKFIPKLKKCRECGNEYMTEFRRGGIGLIEFCSEKCKEEATTKVKQEQHRRKDIKRRKRLAENGKADYSITLRKVIQKFGLTCALCGKKVNTKVHSNHNDYPSIDHIIPVSKGGTHTWGNVQLAHRGCNSTKNNSLYIEDKKGQMRLCV
jgi:5-methylcytosine-specific restriction endonuclease McrA